MGTGGHCDERARNPHETILTLDSAPVQYWRVRLSNELSRTGVLGVSAGRRVPGSAGDDAGSSGSPRPPGPAVRSAAGATCSGSSWSATRSPRGRGARAPATRWPAGWPTCCIDAAVDPSPGRCWPAAEPMPRGVAELVAGSTVVAGADVVAVSVGVNDVKNLRSDAAWRAGLHDLLAAVVRAAPGARVFLLGLPPVDRLPRCLGPWPTCSASRPAARPDRWSRGRRLRRGDPAGVHRGRARRGPTTPSPATGSTPARPCTTCSRTRSRRG